MNNGRSPDPDAHSVSDTYSPAAPDQAVTILDALLYLSALAALAGAWTRNVTSMALLASFAFSEALCQAEVPFNLWLWAGIDIAVIVAIMRGGLFPRSQAAVTKLDAVIVAMFAPVFVLYLAQPEWWRGAVILIVAAQMFLTFPAPLLKRAWDRARATPWPRDPFDDFDLRAYA